MAQLWGGRFTKETDQLVYNFNASISFDKKFYEQDIRGSIAHVTMLAKQGILTAEEKEQIIDGLEEIRADVENGVLEITDEYEDIHSFVEANLIDRIGEPGKKLHTGRSRNDQVALDMKLYTRDEILDLDKLLKELLEVLLNLMKENTETYMPGFTHLQKAQPITLAHHLGAYFEMFKRDRSRMKDIYKRMNYCPTIPVAPKIPTLNFCSIFLSFSFPLVLTIFFPQPAADPARPGIPYRMSFGILFSYLLYAQIRLLQSDNFFHGCFSRSADCVSHFHAGFHTDCLIDIFFKYRGYCLEFFQGHIVQRDIFFDTVKNQLPHDTMRIPKRHAMIDQIIRCIRCIRKSVFRTVFHTRFIKTHCPDHSRKQRQTSLCRVNGIEHQLFVLLHILIIGKRNSLHRCEK